MALQIHSSPSSFFKKPYQYPHHLLHLSSSTKPTNLKIRSQSTEEPANNNNNPPKKPTTTGSSPGQGFGSKSSTPTSSSSSSKSSSSKATSSAGGGSKKKQKDKRDRATIIRRTPVEKPAFVSQENEAKVKEQSRNESAFLLAWLVLGAVILVEGIVLAASVFLPEEWDKFFVKYLYPSFTPTVGLFVAGTVAYGVSKYLQNENLKDQK